MECGYLVTDFNFKHPKALKNARLSKNRNLQQSLRSIGEKLGLLGLGLRFNLTMHVARHTFVVLSIKKGIDVHLLSRLMGHSFIVFTEKVYADFIQSDVHKEVREKLSFTF